MSFDDDDNGEIPGDRLSAILVHVGATRKGIRRLEGDVKEVKEKLDDLARRAVTIDGCSHIHARLDRELDNVKQELRRKPTGTGHPNVTAALAAQVAQGVKPQEVVEEVLERRQDKRRRSVNFWLATMGAAVGLISGAVVGIVKLGAYLDKLNQAVTAQSAQSDELRQELAKRRTIIIKEPIRPDAGPTPPAPPSSVSKRKWPPR